MKKSFLGILFIVLFSGVGQQLHAAAQNQQRYEESLDKGFDWLGAHGYQIIEGKMSKQEMQRGWLKNSTNLVNAMNFIGKQVFEQRSESPRRSQSPRHSRRESGSGPERTLDPRGRGYDERKGFVGGKEFSFDPFSIFNSPSSQPDSNQPTVEVGTQDEDLFSSFSDLAGGSTLGSSSVNFNSLPFDNQGGEAERTGESDSFTSSEGTSTPEVVGGLFHFHPQHLNAFLSSEKK